MCIIQYMFQKLTIVGTILSLFDFVKNCYHLKNIPALRAKGLHIVELNTRARVALVVKGGANSFSIREGDYCLSGAYSNIVF